MEDAIYRHAIVVNQNVPEVLKFLKTELQNLGDSIIFSTQEFNKTKNILRIGLNKDLEGNKNLSSSEKQKFIMEELKKIRLTSSKVNEFGKADKQLVESSLKKPALVALQQLGYIEASFSLHIYKEQSTMEKLIWSSLYQLPVEEIRNYFGERLGFYFGFLQMYNMLLIVLAGFSAFVFIPQAVFHAFQGSSLCTRAYFIPHFICELHDPFSIVFSFLMLATITALFQDWKYQTQKLQVTWKVAPKEQSGRLDDSKISAYLVSIFVISVLLAFSSAVIVGGMNVTGAIAPSSWLFIPFLHNPFGTSTIASVLSSTVFAVVLVALDAAFRTVAAILTKREKHGDPESESNARALKIFLFNAISVFSGMAYVAFYEADITGLTSQVRTLFLTDVLRRIGVYVLVPFLKTDWRPWNWIKMVDNDAIELQMKREPYPGLLDQYIELANQFGYLVLFGPVWPWAFIISAVSFWIEARLYLVRYLKLVQRPQYEHARSIGIWRGVFEGIQYCAILSNGLLFSYTSPIIKGLSAFTALSVLFVWEHVLLGSLKILKMVIPNNHRVDGGYVAKASQRSKQD